MRAASNVWRYVEWKRQVAERKVEAVIKSSECGRVNESGG